MKLKYICENNHYFNNTFVIFVVLNKNIKTMTANLENKSNTNLCHLYYGKLSEIPGCWETLFIKLIYIQLYLGYFHF